MKTNAILSLSAVIISGVSLTACGPGEGRIDLRELDCDLHPGIEEPRDTNYHVTPQKKVTQTKVSKTSKKYSKAKRTVKRPSTKLTASEKEVIKEVDKEAGY